ncbi:MAG: ABC transporter, partial [Desulfovibrio sp.]|nr:ABC transporter [Desulfovibrio sp.]
AAAAYLITSRVHKFLDATSKDCRKHRLAMYKWLNTMLQGIKDVLISGGEQSFRAAYDQEAIQAARLTAVQKLTTDLPSQIIETVGILLLVATIFLLSLGEGDGRGSTTGSMALLAICAWRLLPAANRILAGLSSLRTSLPYVDSGLKHLAAVERLSPATSALVEAPALRQELGLEDIFFSYEGVDILAGISLRVPCGEVLGLVGRSGAGKSTVADIIMGLLEPTRGRMLLDGLPLAAEALPSWRRQVGYVPQDPFLMDGTLAENIAFGDPDPDRQRIADCCTMASMDFLETLAEGLNTVLGERGLRLSGGQRQRVAIARALYHDPKILVFDEATSALDAGHERAVQETILGLRGERTLILIAHRLETLHHCDRLIWIEQGGVVQVGTPEQILPDYQQALDTAT